MARDIFGNQRKLRKEKDYRYKTSEWDITKEKLNFIRVNTVVLPLAGEPSYENSRF